MKIKFRYMMMAAVAAFAMTSCDVSSIDDLEGIYGEPQDATVTGATVADKTKDGNMRTYTMDFTTKEGNAIHLVMLSDQYYLLGTTYSLADAATAKKGNFISGQSTVNGSAITDGSFTMTKNDDDYALTRSTLFTADGKSYAVTGSFNYPFEPDDPTAVNNLGSIVNNGDGTVTVHFTAGNFTATQSTTTWMYEYTGEGFDWQITFILPDGKLKAGTYSPNTGYVVGYETGYESYGWFAGTSWGEIANGAKNLTYITTGDIIVTKDGPMYTILLDQGKGGVYAQFQGAISDLDPDGGGNVTMMTSCLGTSNYAQWGWTNLIDIQLANGTLTSSYDAATYTTTYSGTGDFLQLEVYSETGVGTLARGTYEIADDSSWAAMKFKAGNVGMYGDSGTFLKTYTDGVAGSAQFITSGTLTIEGEGDATKFTLTTKDADGKDITYMFTGNVGL